jgi:6-phosphogluconolactonase
MSKRLMLLFISVFFGQLLQAGQADTLSLVIGTRVADGEKGLYSCEFNVKTGKLSEPSLKYNTFGTTIVAHEKANGVIYTCGSGLSNKEAGYVKAFKEGELISESSSYGNQPCYVSTDIERKFLFLANISNGIVSCLNLNEAGEITGLASKIAVTPLKKAFKPHAIVSSVDGRFLFVPDIGGGRIVKLSLDRQSGKLKFVESIVSKDFVGPRHFTFDQEGKTGYLVNQMGEAVTVFRYDAKDGKLTQIGHEQSLPDDKLTINNHIAEIKIHPSGKYVYVSNRGHNSVTLYNRDQKTGELSFVECVSSEGLAPWSFVLGPQGRYLFCSNSKSNNLAVFKIDPKDGRLAYTGEQVSVRSPVSVVCFENN